jgi:hypothetical protein
MQASIQHAASNGPALPCDMCTQIKTSNNESIGIFSIAWQALVDQQTLIYTIGVLQVPLVLSFL